MAINITGFLVTAEREDFPVRMIRFALNNFNTKVGDRNETGGRTMSLMNSTIHDLQQISLGMHFMKSTSPGESFYKFWGNYSGAVRDLYHEATHANLLHKEQAGDFGYLKLRDKAMDYYKGARLDEDRVADDERTIVNEAAAMYVGNQAFVMWDTLNSLYTTLQRDLIERSRDLNVIKRNVANLWHAYDEKINNRIFGYEKHRGKDYLVIDRQIPKFLSDMCDNDLLESKIPKMFAGAPRLVYLYQEIMRQISFGPDRGVPRRP